MAWVGGAGTAGLLPLLRLAKHCHHPQANGGDACPPHPRPVEAYPRRCFFHCRGARRRPSRQRCGTSLPTCAKPSVSARHFLRCSSLLCLRRDVVGFSVSLFLAPPQGAAGCCVKKPGGEREQEGDRGGEVKVSVSVPQVLSRACPSQMKKIFNVNLSCTFVVVYRYTVRAA